MIRTGLFVGLLMGVTVAHAAAQTEPVTEPLDTLVWMQAVPPPPPPPPPPGVGGMAMAAEAVGWLPFELNMDPMPVQGAPYSATAVTETTQVLSDGNRIARKMEVTIYRDGEGRTRREQTLTGIGPIEMIGQGRQTVTINDPVSGEHYILDPEHLRARRMKVFARTDLPPDIANVERELVVNIEKRQGLTDQPQVTDHVTFTAAGQPGEMVTFSAGAKVSVARAAQSESLGSQVIEGVSADGTRSTIVIPAGQIGNERQIEVVSERWFSPELKTTVMSRHSDPRTGETVYRLTNVARVEPDATLFQVPPDYTIEEMPGKGQIIRSIRKEP